VRATLRFAATSRGEHEIEGLRLTTTYPLGFVRALILLACRQRYLVYPKPAGDPKLPLNRGLSSQSQTLAAVRQGDDFSGLRPYLPGESQRHIDWKAVARGQPLMTKQYTTEATGILYLDFALIGSGDTEARLAQLALWTIEAERARIPYGLRIAGVEIRPSVGEAHFHECLRTLALYK
jgi:uncharacterized protein (DUF58 family)